MVAQASGVQTIAGRAPCPTRRREDSGALDAAKIDSDGMDGRGAAIGSETTQIARCIATIDKNRGDTNQRERPRSGRRHPRRAAARRGRSAVAENLHCSGPVTGRRRHGPNPCDRGLCRFTPSFEQLFAHVRSTDPTIAGYAATAETRKLLTLHGTITGTRRREFSTIARECLRRRRQRPPCRLAMAV
jgi:hypothetical protein